MSVGRAATGVGSYASPPIPTVDVGNPRAPWLPSPKLITVLIHLRLTTLSAFSFLNNSRDRHISFTLAVPCLPTCLLLSLPVPDSRWIYFLLHNIAQVRFIGPSGRDSYGPYRVIWPNQYQPKEGEAVEWNIRISAGTVREDNNHKK